MPEVVRPRGVVLYAYTAGSYIPIACAKDVTFSTNNTFLQLAPKTSGIYESFIPQRVQQTISGTGMTVMKSTTLWSFQELEDRLMAQTQFVAKIIISGEDGTLRIKAYNVYVESLSVSGSASNFSTFNYSLKVTGAPTITDITPPENCLIYDVDGTFIVDADGTYLDAACNAITGVNTDFASADFSSPDFL